MTDCTANSMTERRAGIFYFHHCSAFDFWQKMIIIIIMMIVIVTVKGAVRDFFFSVSSLRRELSPAHTLKWSGRNRVQITCMLSAKCTKGQLSY